MEKKSKLCYQALSRKRAWKELENLEMRFPIICNGEV